MFVSTMTVLDKLSPLVLDVFFLFNNKNKGLLTTKKLARLLNMDGRSSFAILNFLVGKQTVEGVLGRYRIQKINRRNLMLKVEKIGGKG